MASGSSNSRLGIATTTIHAELRKQQGLEMFQELVSSNVSVKVLAMGISLLQQTWEQVGDSSGWDPIENEILAEVTLLDEVYADLERQLTRANRS